MTSRTKYAARRLAVPAAAIAGLLLAGCSSGNIGESWQCPLAKSGSCDSVAAVDPAVPEAAGRTVSREPLWRVRAVEPADKPEAPACEAECGGGFDPFGWLMRLLGAGDGQEVRPAEGAPHPLVPPPAVAPPMEVPSAAVSPADLAPLPADSGTAAEEPGGADLRTDEVVARIWIAPFVDADGVYREASHVRVVLEPAGWRLPR